MNDDEKKLDLDKLLKTDRPAPQHLIDYIIKEAKGEIPERFPDAPEACFITEEMEADGTAQKIRENMAEPIFINRVKKE